jgi:hypothetical protein
VALREEAGGEEFEGFKGFKEFKGFELLGSSGEQILYVGDTPGHPLRGWGLLRCGMEVLYACRSS